MLCNAYERQKMLLNAIDAFRPIARYDGMMPRHVAIMFCKDDIDTVEGSGLICWDVFINENDCIIRGLRLTEIGITALHHPDFS
ncbi:hypothetical protein [Solidesulfovibrio sp.]